VIKFIDIKEWREIKVIFAGLSWPPETFIERLIRGLMEGGVEVTVACDVKPACDWFSSPNFRWLWTPFWSGIPLTKRLWSQFILLVGGLVRDSAAVWKILRLDAESFTERLKNWHKLLPFVGRSWDVIYIPWNFGAIEYLLLFDLGIPVVVSCRGAQINIEPHDPGSKGILDKLRLTFQKTTAVHCVSEAIKNEASRYGLDPRKARVIHPSVDPGFFRPAEQVESANETFDLISTGSLTWRKGYDYALVALRRLWDQGIPAHFHIIGDGPGFSRLLYTISDLNLTGKVHLHGRLTPLEVRDRLQRSNAFLLSSVSEGISNAVLEAMACGLPVVSTDCGGMREAITDGKDGFLVPVRDPEAMAVALARLAMDPELSRRLGQAARQRIIEEFTLDGQIGKFIELYQEVIKNSAAKYFS
jgi:colanic acid/amylovoran biosynthesis glycosyltransferase